MIITPIKTKLIKAGDDIKDIIKQSIKKIPENSILVVASKIISTCEDRFVKKIDGTKEEKYNLIRQESELYTDAHSSKYNVMLTIKQNFIFVNAGIDESNANNQYILWPQNPQMSVNKIWTFVKDYYGIKNFGVTMSDSSSFMLNWGVVWRAIVYCGFNPLRSYIDKPDLFGKLMKMEQSNIMQSITDAAVLEMGEGNECMPLAIVSDFKQPIEFVDHEPTNEDLSRLKIDIEDDVYYPILKNVQWHIGGAFMPK